MLESIERNLHIPKLFSKAALQFSSHRKHPTLLVRKALVSPSQSRKSKLHSIKFEPFSLALSREYVDRVSGEHRRAASQNPDSKLPQAKVKMLVDYTRSQRTSQVRRPKTGKVEDIDLTLTMPPATNVFSRSIGFVEMAKQKGRESERSLRVPEVDGCSPPPIAMSSQHKRIVRDIVFSSPVCKPIKLTRRRLTPSACHNKNFTLVDPRTPQAPSYDQMLGRKMPADPAPYLFLGFYDPELPKAKIPAPLFHRQTGRPNNGSPRLPALAT